MAEAENISVGNTSIQPLSAFEVGQYFIRKGNNDPQNLTYLKLQLLLYYSQGWYLVFNEDALFKDEIIATMYGIEIPSIQAVYGWYGLRDLSELDPRKIDYPSILEKFLDKIWDIYAKQDFKILAKKTLSPSSPYSITVKSYGKSPDSMWGNENFIIPIEVLRDYFKSKITP